MGSSKTSPTRSALPAGKARRKATLLIPWGQRWDQRAAPDAPTLTPTPTKTTGAGGAAVPVAAASSPETEPLSEYRSLVGPRIGNYVVDRELGRGGMGAVYVARHVDA